MLLNNSVRYPQSQARALYILGREERLENFLLVRWVDARTRVE